MNPEQRYEELLKKGRAEGRPAPGVRLGIPGWKVPSKKTMLELFLDGKITATQALRAGLTEKDMSAKLGKARNIEELTKLVKEMVAAGMDVRKLKAGR